MISKPSESYQTFGEWEVEEGLGGGGGVARKKEKKPEIESLTRRLLLLPSAHG